MKDLKKIWKRQLKFNKNFFDFDKSNIEEKQQMTKEIILHLISEADEVLNETNWKMHRKKALAVREDRLREEIIDVFKYWLTLAQIWKISPEDFLEEFERKSNVVEQKYKQEFDLSIIDDKNVVGIDIDGVLAEYPKGFLNFIKDETGINLNNEEIKTYNLYDAVGEIVGADKMKKLKHKFRAEGHKRNLPVIPGAQEGLKRLRDQGKTIILLSARPYKEYPRIFGDTIDWLNKNNFDFDAIIWDEEKEEKIIKEFPNMKFMVEDNGNNALKIAQAGYKVYLINKTYNQGAVHKNIIRVDGWDEI